MLSDAFGDGSPDAAFGVDELSGTGPEQAGFDPHGYGVLSMAAAAWNPPASVSSSRALITGMYPGRLRAVLVDHAQVASSLPSFLGAWYTESQIMGRITRALLRTDGPVVLNTSHGAPRLVPPLLWAVSNQLWEDRVIHVSSQGNPDNCGIFPYCSGFNATNGLNLLTVDSMAHTGTPPRPGSLESLGGGMLAGVGNGAALSCATGTCPPCADGCPGGTPGAVQGVAGSSFAAPQVAGLAAYVWALAGLDKSVSQIISILTGQALDHDQDEDTPPVIDAYAAVLAVDALTGSTRVRREILANADLDNSSFDERDLTAFLDAFDQAAGAVDYSRFDLNGDGRTGGATQQAHDLTVDGSIGELFSARYCLRDENGLASSDCIALDERQLTDVDILCYYASGWEILPEERRVTYEGSDTARADLLASRCGPAPEQTMDFLAFSGTPAAGTAKVGLIEVELTSTNTIGPLLGGLRAVPDEVSPSTATLRFSRPISSFSLELRGDFSQGEFIESATLGSPSALSPGLVEQDGRVTVISQRTVHHIFWNDLDETSEVTLTVSADPQLSDPYLTLDRARFRRFVQAP